MNDIINDILSATKKRISKLDIKPIKFFNVDKRDIISSICHIKQQGKVPIIAEVKPASPNNSLRDISPLDASLIAKEMQRAGAVGISVLTEPDFFKGSIENLKSARSAVSIPVLRKDFIIDKSQMNEVESDLILLIAGILGDELEEFVSHAILKGFEPLVEVHTKKELEFALKTDAKIIGINNRDLNTMEINLNTTEILAPIVRKFDKEYGMERIIISESGIKTKEDVKKIISAGADAILIGTTIIQSLKNKNYTKYDGVYITTRNFIEALQ